MNSWLQDNDIEMHSTHNEVKPVFNERFIRSFTYMKSIYDFNIKKCAY